MARKHFCLSFVLSLAVLFPLTASAEQSNVMDAGSPDRREFCNALAEVFGAAYYRLSEGMTLERYVKMVETEYAGTDNDGFFSTIFVGAMITEYYIQAGQTLEDLKIDFLHPCITTSKTMEEVLIAWTKEAMPKDHPVRQKLLADESSLSPTFNEDGTLSPGEYAAIFNGDALGTQAVSSLVRRKDGEIIGCGYEFAHVELDYIYTEGRPVKLSGSMNILEHAKSLLVTFLKVKGEDVIISRSPDGLPQPRATAFQIESLYFTLNDKPILGDPLKMSCDDDGYACHADFSWDKVTEAMMTNAAGFGYRRADGTTDALIQLDWSKPDDAKKEVSSFFNCTAELLSRKGSEVLGSESQ